MLMWWLVHLWFVGITVVFILYVLFLAFVFFWLRLMVRV